MTTVPASEIEGSQATGPAPARISAAPGPIQKEQIAMQRPALLVLLTLLLVAATATPATADERSAKDPRSTSLDYTLQIGYSDGDGHQVPRTVKIAGVDGRASEFSSGRRVRFATRTGSDASEGGGTFTSYSYQHVGLTVRLHGSVLDDGRVVVAGKVEISSPSPVQQSDEAPEVASFDYDFNAVLRNGVEAVLAEVPEPDGGTRTLKLTVEVGD